MQQGEEVVYLYLDDIIPNRFQPREVFDERPLKELAVSIKEHGVIQPIIVRKVNDKYEIIAGERRYKASALAGLTKIPAIIRDLDDKETSKVALLENLQRKNLNPLEEAKTYQKILEIDEMTQEELAKTMGKSQSAVSNKIRLLSLSEEVQQALLKEEISERHARALLNVENKEEQNKLLKEIIDNKMTVRQLEAKIKGENTPEQSINEVSSEISPNISIPQNSEDIGSQANFLSSSPLIPNFGGDESSTQDNTIASIFNNNNQQENEPLIVNTNNESNPIMNQTEEDKEPLITMPNENNNINQSENSQSNEPLIMMPTNSNESSNDSDNDSSSENNKFINFGEIDDDEDDEPTDEKFYEDTVTDSPSISFGEGPISANNAIDLDNLKQNTKDINIKDAEKPGADLDSLLRINNADFSTNNSNTEENNSFKFFSPAAEAIKESENNEKPKSSEDYFKAPDLMGIDLPGEVPTYNTNNVPLAGNIDNKTITDANKNSLEDAINIINDSIKQIEQSGIKVEKDEMNLNNSYQVIIKLEKNN